MDGRAAQGGLTGRSLAHGNLVFAVAGAADEANIRRLMRDNALGGWVALSLEREPDAFAADFGLSRSHAFIIARDRATGAAVGLCERSVRDAFVDDEVCRLPFLGAPAPFSAGPYILAHLLGCPVYLLHCLREGDEYRLHFDRLAERIELPRGAAREVAIAGYAASYAARLGEMVCRAPFQWYNFFDFWAQ